MPARLRLLDIRCVKQQELGGDEPYLLVRKDKVWSHKDMKSGMVISLRSIQPFPFMEEIDIALMEAERIGRDDLLGSGTITIHQLGKGEQQLEFRDGGCHYQVVYEVVAEASTAASASAPQAPAPPQGGGLGSRTPAASGGGFGSGKPTLGNKPAGGGMGGGGGLGATPLFAGQLDVTMSTSLWLALAFLVLASADGNISEGEVQAYQRAIRANGLPDPSQRFSWPQMVAMTNDGTLQNLSAHIGAVLSADRRNALIPIMLQIIVADGQAGHAELAKMQQVAAWIGAQVTVRFA